MDMQNRNGTQIILCLQINTCSYSIHISGTACRFKVVGWLRKKFEKPIDAERYYNDERTTCTIDVQTDVSVDAKADDMKLLSSLFAQACEKEYNITVPKDYLVLSAFAMMQLEKANRSNVLYNLALGLGTSREDNSDSRFPTQRMPMGLIEHTINFFVANNANQVDTKQY